MTIVFASRLLDEASFLNEKEKLLSIIPAACAEKVLSYHHSADQQRHLLGELLSRYALYSETGLKPDKPFTSGEKGKPHPDGYNGIHFNISHSGEWVTVAISDKAVGVDIEKIRKVPEGVAYRFFSEPEKQWLDTAGNDSEKAHIFFTLWTLKESFLKALGKGLTKSLNSFTIYRDADGEYRLADDPEALGFHLFAFSFEEGYKLAVCTASPVTEKKVKILPVKEISDALMLTSQ